MKNIVLFASGSGSNAKKIIDYFSSNSSIIVSCVLSNNINAKVLEIANQNNIETFTFDKKQLENGAVLNELLVLNADLIVLAGFLLKCPTHIVAAFKNKIINIHPALLPKYGGKGMYGMHIHKAVLENKEIESGITIHYVNENYDEGAFIFQKSVSIIDCTTAEEIGVKILQLEHLYFAKQIEKLLTSEI